MEQLSAPTPTSRVISSQKQIFQKRVTSKLYPRKWHCPNLINISQRTIFLERGNQSNIKKQFNYFIPHLKVFLTISRTVPSDSRNHIKCSQFLDVHRGLTGNRKLKKLSSCFFIRKSYNIKVTYIVKVNCCQQCQPTNHYIGKLKSLQVCARRRSFKFQLRPQTIQQLFLTPLNSFCLI